MSWLKFAKNLEGEAQTKTPEEEEEKGYLQQYLSSLEVEEEETQSPLSGLTWEVSTQPRVWEQPYWGVTRQTPAVKDLTSNLTSNLTPKQKADIQLITKSAEAEKQKDKFSEWWGEQVTAPFRGEKPYKELPWGVRMIAEMTEPTGFLLPGGASKGVAKNIITSLLKRSETTADDIIKALAKSGIVGKEAENVIDDFFTNFSKYVPKEQQTKMASQILSEAVKLSKTPEVSTEASKIVSQVTDLGNVTQSLTKEETDTLLRKFSDFLLSQDLAKREELTRELFRKERSVKFRLFNEELDNLLAKGVDFEEATKQASSKLKGKLSSVKSDFVDDVTDQFRIVLFNKIYDVLKGDATEILNTVNALQRLLKDGRINRIPGTKGQSGYSRLVRVFGRDIIDALDTGKPIREVMEDVLYKGTEYPPLEFPEYKNIPYGKPRLWEKPFEEIHIEDTRTAAQREIELQQLKLDIIKAQEVAQQIPDRSIMDTISEMNKMDNEAAKILYLMPKEQQYLVIRTLKALGWGVVDIGNFLRANKASFDFSFWRQIAPFIFRHPKTFIQANIDAWKALKSDDFAKQFWKEIASDPLYNLYDELGLDFLRPGEVGAGFPQYRLVEEFGYAGAERPISKFTEKVPWIKVSQRAFVAGTNSMTWRIFKNHYKTLLDVNEKIAIGKIKLKPGEIWDIRGELKKMGELLSDFTGRGSFGKKYQGVAPFLSSILFAPRMLVGRFMTPKHLFSTSKYVRREAWSALGSFVAATSSIILLGKQLGIWDVDLNRNSSDFMKIRIGNTRIDPWGGYQQFAVFYSRMADAFIANIKDEETINNPWNVINRFMESKFAPLTSVVKEFITGKTFLGEDVDITNPKQWADKLVPFAIIDIYEALADNWIIGTAVALPIVVGAGVQTYEDKLLVKKSLLGEVDDKGELYTLSKFGGDVSRRKDYLTIVEQKDRLIQLRLEYDKLLETYKKLDENKREAWRVKHPREDAIMYLFGYFESLASDEGEEKVISLQKEYKIPDNAIRQKLTKKKTTSTSSTSRTYTSSTTQPVYTPPPTTPSGGSWLSKFK